MLWSKEPAPYNRASIIPDVMGSYAKAQPIKHFISILYNTFY